MPTPGSQSLASISPLKKPGLLVVGFDEAHESLHEFVSRFEDSAADDLARQDAEADFDLVEPAGVGGSEGEVKPFSLGDPSQGFLAAVAGAVVRDDVKLLGRLRPSAASSTMRARRTSRWAADGELMIDPKVVRSSEVSPIWGAPRFTL